MGNKSIVFGVAILSFVIGAPIYANCCPGPCCPSDKVDLARLIAKDVPFDKVLRIAKENSMINSDTRDSIIYKTRLSSKKKNIFGISTSPENVKNKREK